MPIFPTFFLILQRVSIVQPIAMVKVFENDLGTVQVTFLDVETLICGYKQNIRQIWPYEPGT